MAPSSSIEAGAEAPQDSWATTLEVSGSTVQTASAELHPVAPESSVAAAAEPILAPESPAEILRAGAAKENLTNPAIATGAVPSLIRNCGTRASHSVIAAITALAQQELRRLVLNGHRVVSQEVLFKNIGRVRDVCSGPDGLLYVALNGPNKIIRLEPVK